MKTLLALAAVAVTLAGCVMPPPDYGREPDRGGRQFERDQDRGRDHDRDRDGHEDQGGMRPAPGSGYGGESFGGPSRGY